MNIWRITLTGSARQPSQALFGVLISIWARQPRGLLIIQLQLVVKLHGNERRWGKKAEQKCAGGAGGSAFGCAAKTGELFN